LFLSTDVGHTFVGPILFFFHLFQSKPVLPVALTIFCGAMAITNTRHTRSNKNFNEMNSQKRITIEKFFQFKLSAREEVVQHNPICSTQHSKENTIGGVLNQNV
jgi:hypothetical protein